MNGLQQDTKFITPEYMRALEARLTPAQKTRAFELARKNGWKREDDPPMWVWQQLFIQAMAEVPSTDSYQPRAV